jgi:hypothetical protein
MATQRPARNGTLAAFDFDVVTDAPRPPSRRPDPAPSTRAPSPERDGKTDRPEPNLR